MLMGDQAAFGNPLFFLPS
jgi:hypothetical protein